MQMIAEVFQHVGMKYPAIPDSRYVAQTVNGCLFPGLFRWEEEMVSHENAITKNEDVGFSQTLTPPPQQQPPSRLTIPTNWKPNSIAI